MTRYPKMLTLDKMDDVKIKISAVFLQNKQSCHTLSNHSEDA